MDSRHLPWPVRRVKRSIEITTYQMPNVIYDVTNAHSKRPRFQAWLNIQLIDCSRGGGIIYIHKGYFYLSFEKIKSLNFSNNFVTYSFFKSYISTFCFEQRILRYNMSLKNLIYSRHKAHSIQYIPEINRRWKDF